MRGWDRGVSYEEAYRMILRHFKESKRKTQRGYDVILLSQLRNGSRLSEAIEFCRKIAVKPNRYEYVRVLKRKDEYYRLMVLPEEIRLRDIKETCYVLLNANKYKVASYCKRTYNINTHSLRYAFITYLAKKGIPAQLISKITGHKNISYIVHYTQKTTAEDILLKVVKI